MLDQNHSTRHRDGAFDVREDGAIDLSGQTFEREVLATRCVVAFGQRDVTTGAVSRRSRRTQLETFNSDKGVFHNEQAATSRAAEIPPRVGLPWPTPRVRSAEKLGKRVWLTELCPYIRR
jgi:hypothetical protein